MFAVFAVFAVSTRTIGKSLKRQGLSVRHKRKFRRTADSKHKLPVEQNLLDRQFQVEYPNRVWVGGITYLRSSGGRLYLAVMIDLFARQVVGGQMSERIDQELVNVALEAALINRGKPKSGLINTNRGSQYCTYSFVEMISENKLQQSMSRKRNCWESEHCSDAVAASFLASLKKQAIYGRKLASRQGLRGRVFEYIDQYYNRVHRHSANGWITSL